MRLEARIELLESAMVPGDAKVLYDNRAVFRNHECYIVFSDGSAVIVSPDLTQWSDERSLWASRPVGTKFLRVGGGKMVEVLDGVTRNIHFRPIEMTPDARRGMKETLRDLGVGPSHEVEP